MRKDKLAASEIGQVFAWVVVSADGSEDIIVAHVNGTTMPLVFTAAAEAKLMREQAFAYRDTRHVAVKLVEWSARRVIEESKPRTVTTT
jgi:hypothetical protein